MYMMYSQLLLSALRFSAVGLKVELLLRVVSASVRSSLNAII